MDLATRLALKCLAAEKRAASPQDLRSGFEGSVARERSLRDYASRLGDLGNQRAMDEDTSPSGYAGTLATRLAPIPQTLGEAAWRLPAIGAGGVGGYLAGTKLEEIDRFGLNKHRTSDPIAIQKTLTEAAISPESKLVKALQNRVAMKNPGGNPQSVVDAVKQLGAADPGDAAAAIQGSPQLAGLTDKQKSLRGILSGALGGDEHLPFARSQILNAIESGKGKPGALAELVPSVKPYRIGGALAGLAAGSVLTGAPLAARALYLKQHGGESATRARAKMQTAIEQAEAEAGQREGLLSQLPQAGQ